MPLSPPPYGQLSRLLHLRRLSSLWNLYLLGILLVRAPREAVTFTSVAAAVHPVASAVEALLLLRGGTISPTTTTTPHGISSPPPRRQQSSPSSWVSLSSSLGSPQTTDSGDHQTQISIRGELLPSDIPRRDDVITMIAAVRRACAITVALQPVDCDAFETDAAISKQDLSPVTVADFAVQASILQTLLQQQQQDDNDDEICGFIAEEDSAALRKDAALCRAVALACNTHGGGGGNDGSMIMSMEEVIAAVDLGKSYQQWDSTDTKNPKRPRRVYCLDPIDGTRGFLRGRKPGGQYAIALALLDDGVPVIGVLGCPNLPCTRGCIFVAVQGGGCYQLPLKKKNDDDDETSRTATQQPAARRLHVTPQPALAPPPTEVGSTSRNKENKLLATGRFCIGVEKYSDAKGQTFDMARYLQGPNAVTGDGVIVQAQRMDSQAKHGVIARGGAEWYVRLPHPGYREWIWDHAAGHVVVTEAGGSMTDTAGRALDFSLGAKLAPHVRGVLMSSGGIWHEALVEAYTAVEAMENNGETAGQ
jgi:3'(2'), 5'-bisphosphate nucleotidase